jgi:hypothetical protein
MNVIRPAGNGSPLKVTSPLTLALLEQLLKLRARAMNATMAARLMNRESLIAVMTIAPKIRGVYRYKSIGLQNKFAETLEDSQARLG